MKARACTSEGAKSGSIATTRKRPRHGIRVRVSPYA